MRKLKTKYKWLQRESHFMELERHRRLHELYGKALFFGLRPDKIRTMGGLLGFITGNEWTPEQLKEIGAHTTVKSALE